MVSLSEIVTSDSLNKEKWAKLLAGIILDRTGGVPLHLQFQQSLRHIIQTTLHDGERMPSEDEMVEALQISRATIRRALADIAATGLLVRRRAAGTIVTKQRKIPVENIAVIAPAYSSFTQSGHFAALHELADSIGTRISLVTLGKGENWKSYSKQINFAPNQGGVVLLGNTQLTTLDLYRILSQQGYKTVNVAPFIKNYPGHFVGVSNSACMRLGLEFLMKAGHQKILFLVTEPEELDETVERAKHFKATAQKLNLTQTSVMHCGLHSWENASEAASQAMATICSDPAKRPTAIFCISDGTAMGALLGLTRLGINVPDDISILSYDGTALTRLAQPKLTTLVTPMDQVAREVFTILGSDHPPRCEVLIEPHIQEAESIRVLKNGP